jgi:hypothetical protein
MNETSLLNFVRRDWWILALVAYVAWSIESLIAGNTPLEILAGSLLVCVWAAAIVLIDRWVLKTTDREKPHP